MYIPKRATNREMMNSILTAVDNYVLEHDHSPTLRQISVVLGVDIAKLNGYAAVLCDQGRLQQFKREGKPVYAPVGTELDF